MKQQPERTCVGCGIKNEKNQFVRIVKHNNSVDIDKTGKKDGRGAYICNNIECVNKAYKTKRLERSFKMKINDEFYERLKGIVVDK